MTDFRLQIAHEVTIVPTEIRLDGQLLLTTPTDLLATVYRERIGDYPKFFKMDVLSKLGFVASELLLQACGDRFSESEDTAIVLFNRSSSLAADTRFQQTIASTDAWFPSPALFVYTLPNIVTGEIAIRNKWYGETMFYVLAEPNEPLQHQVVTDLFADGTASRALTGWIEATDDAHFQAKLQIINKLNDNE